MHHEQPRVCLLFAISKNLHPANLSKLRRGEARLPAVPGQPLPHRLRFLRAAGMPRIHHDRQHSARPQPRQCRVQCPQSCFAPRNHRPVATRQIAEIEKYRADLSAPIRRQPLRHRLMPGQHQLYAFSKAFPALVHYPIQPRPCRRYCCRLHIKRHNPAPGPDGPRQKHRVVPVSRRGIHGEIPHTQYSCGDFMGELRKRRHPRNTPSPSAGFNLKSAHERTRTWTQVSLTLRPGPQSCPATF